MKNCIVKVPKDKSNSSDIIHIGKQHENNATMIEFDCSDWIETITPEGIFRLNIRRSGDSASYPAVTETEDTTVKWTVRDVDTENDGSGYAELEYRVYDVVVRSCSWKTYVASSITDVSGPAPDPYESWIEHLTELGVKTEQNAASAAQSAADAEASAVDAEASAVDASQAADGAETSANNANISAQAAQDAANSMSFVSFDIDPDGDLYINRSERLGTTAFELNENGELEVSI